MRWAQRDTLPASRHLDEQLAAFGAPEDVRAQLAEEAVADEFVLYEDNVEIDRAFRALSTQWRVVVGPVGALWLGLDYGSVPAVLDLLDVPPERRAEVFSGVRLMEAAALPVLNGGEPVNPDE